MFVAVGVDLDEARIFILDLGGRWGRLLEGRMVVLVRF